MCFSPRDHQHGDRDQDQGGRVRWFLAEIPVRAMATRRKRGASAPTRPSPGPERRARTTDGERYWIFKADRCEARLAGGQASRQAGKQASRQASLPFPPFVPQGSQRISSGFPWSRQDRMLHQAGGHMHCVPAGGRLSLCWPSPSSLLSLLALPACRDEWPWARARQEEGDAAPRMKWECVR